MSKWRRETDPYSPSQRRSGGSICMAALQYPPLTRRARLCWWLAELLAPRDGSRYGPSVFGRSVQRASKDV